MNDIPRLSARERTILELLVSNGEMYGLQLVKASPEIKRGAVYVTLSRMADKGFVKSRRVEEEALPGKPRPRYSITGLGQTALNAHDSYVAHFTYKGAPA
ncbi:MAG: helix-turn-helix transcriptional regulator [Pseudomonadota bacterium]